MLTFCVTYLIIDRSRLIGTVANILTSLLLISIAVMVISSAFTHGEADPQTMSNYDLFKGSLFQGYNTQDLLSSLFFSSSLILISVYLTALLEFEGIMKIVSPVMQIMYPVIMIVVLKFLFDLWKSHNQQKNSVLPDS